MVDVTTMLRASLTTAMTQHSEIHGKWVRISHQLAGKYGAVILARQSDTRIDLLLRTIEEERLVSLNKPMPHESQEVDFALDLQMALSEHWVMSSYETIRACCQRARERGERDEKLVALRNRLALVRMPIAKGEIANTNNKTPDIMLGHAEDDGEPHMYKNDGSYIIPRGICGQTGAAMWVPVDVKTMKSVEICRRDLSDEFLALFD